MQTAKHHEEKIDRALQADVAAHDFVAASWQRSANVHRLEPCRTHAPHRLSADEFKQACERLGPLVDTAQTSLDRLYQAVGCDGCCVLLADRNGIPVDRRGAAGDDVTFKEWGLWTGTVWSESHEGTNGIGTSIVEERALTIHMDQHFHVKNTGLSCSAAPIFDHEGNLIAVLDVSSCRSDMSAGFSRLVSMTVLDAARQIEAAHFEYKFSDARIVLANAPQDFGRAHCGQQGVSLVAVDRDDMVVGATRAARRLFGLNDDDLKKPLPLSLLYGQQVNDASQYSQAGRRTILQALARQNGNVSAAARALGVSRATLHRKIKYLKIDC